ncbi:NAD-dependent epimerase/dehydratase family protein [Terriglobus albidus]|uniref:NAD-dependent epimerase/dehydratase family protein n=1 Tax=Terriglobus albidus TaxID=1592106 RepID=A0A5B9E5B7_9BACT|nr:NAD(P)H-binding protein [Terriglobus albidus]QEE26979.1 NAD-dependent epimerase/dehydratase family protein [Terriglobus albidus]
MISVMGVTGQVGGAIARKLIAEGKKVRVVVRSTDKGEIWKRASAEVAVASTDDTAALTRAFANTEAVFVMLPPVFDPAPGYPESAAATTSIRNALEAAKPGRVIALSTIGGQVDRDNLLIQLHHWEQALRTLGLPIVFLRPTWFIENTQWLLAAAREKGVFASHLQPLDKPVPMVAVDDIATTASDLLTGKDRTTGIVELTGPQDVTPIEIASTLGHFFSREVRAQAIPRETWETEFRAAGMQHPEPRMRMLDGFNEGWIRFEGAPRRGTTTLETALRQLILQKA